MNCETWQDKIDAFVDSELPAGQALGFEEHLRACPACSAETLARQRLKVETRLAGQRFRPSAEFERQLRQRFARKRPWMAWFPVFAGAAAIVVLGVAFLGTAWRDRTVRQQVVAQLVDQHVATLASDNPVDVVSTDSHTVKPWFSGKVPFSVDLPNLDGTDFKLIGGRITYLQQIPAAQLVFAVRKHRISVFMLREGPAVSALGNDASPAHRTGFTTQTWVEEGIRYFAISDVNGEDVHKLCDLLKQSSGP
jgi:anti-sigma factor RsiW